MQTLGLGTLPRKNLTKIAVLAFLLDADARFPGAWLGIGEIAKGTTGNYHTLQKLLPRWTKWRYLRCAEQGLRKRYQIGSKGRNYLASTHKWFPHISAVTFILSRATSHMVAVPYEGRWLVIREPYTDRRDFWAQPEAPAGAMEIGARKTLADSIQGLFANADLFMKAKGTQVPAEFRKYVTETVAKGEF